MVNSDRARQVKDVFDTEGIDAASKRFSITRETVLRYVRKAKEKPRNVKILTIDIETSPILVSTFGIRKQFISHTNIIRDWHLLTFAAKWLDSDDVITERLTAREAIDGDDERLVRLAWDLINEADILIAHNGDRFDFKKLNARFWKYDMIPPSSYQTIDTLKNSFRNFAHTSAKLDYLLKFKSMEGKTDNSGMELWMRCIGYGEIGTEAEVDEAMEEMLEYNKNDTVILEEHYLDVRPWIKNHPNVALYDDEQIERCTVCGSDDIKWDGKTYTPANRYSEYRCQNCGHVGRARLSELTPNKRKTLTR